MMPLAPTPIVAVPSKPKIGFSIDSIVGGGGGGSPAAPPRSPDCDVVTTDSPPPSPASSSSPPAAYRAAAASPPPMVVRPSALPPPFAQEAGGGPLKALYLPEPMVHHPHVHAHAHHHQQLQALAAAAAAQHFGLAAAALQGGGPGAAGFPPAPGGGHHLQPHHPPPRDTYPLYPWLLSRHGRIFPHRFPAASGDASVDLFQTKSVQGIVGGSASVDLFQTKSVQGIVGGSASAVAGYAVRMQVDLTQGDFKSARFTANSIHLHVTSAARIKSSLLECRVARWPHLQQATDPERKVSASCWWASVRGPRAATKSLLPAERNEATRRCVLTRSCAEDEVDRPRWLRTTNLRFPTLNCFSANTSSMKTNERSTSYLVYEHDATLIQTCEPKIVIPPNYGHWGILNISRNSVNAHFCSLRCNDAIRLLMGKRHDEDTFKYAMVQKQRPLHKIPFPNAPVLTGKECLQWAAFMLKKRNFVAVTLMWVYPFADGLRGVLEQALCLTGYHVLLKIPHRLGCQLGSKLPCADWRTVLGRVMLASCAIFLACAAEATDSELQCQILSPDCVIISDFLDCPSLWLRICSYPRQKISSCRRHFGYTRRNSRGRTLARPPRTAQRRSLRAHRTFSRCETGAGPIPLAGHAEDTQLRMSDTPSPPLLTPGNQLHALWDSSKSDQNIYSQCFGTAAERSLLAEQCFDTAEGGHSPRSQDQVAASCRVPSPNCSCLPRPGVGGAAMAERLACLPPTKVSRVQSPARITRFSHAGIVPDDVAGRRVFSGVSPFPPPFIPAPLHTHLNHPHRLSRPRC
ncbi:hypothetical protein PR048_030304 [Dryococelus australis]|uniref:Uncharacterized protein n=1 Tax=Dryococelus australis TaxID=614101 RepID=A0ABQ9G8L0_9NEOP|nr:hypothetical protein PR048_030304 [Dryococelus australis]